MRITRGGLLRSSDASAAYLTPAAANAAYVSQAAAGIVVAPAPTGVKATDEANVQPLLDALSISGGTLVLRKGDYMGDFILQQGPTGEQLPRIIGQGERYTRINSLTIQGYELHSSGCYLSDFGFYSHHPTTGVALDIVGAQSVHWDRLGFWRAHTIGIRFYSPDALTWTEKCNGQANFGDNCLTPLKYQADGVNGSFNSCGLTMGSEINQKTGSTAPLIDMGAGAFVYSAPMSVHIWVQTDTQPLIKNNGNVNNNFCGNLRIEQLGTAQNAIIVDPAGTNPVYYTGTLTIQGYADTVNRDRFTPCTGFGVGLANRPIVETTSNLPVMTSAFRAAKYLALGGPTSTSGSLGGGTLRLMPQYIPQQIKIDRVCAETTVAGEVGSVMRIGIYRDGGCFPENALPIVDQTVTTAAVGIQESGTFATPVILNPGWYWVGGSIQNTPATLTSALSTSGAITSLAVTATTVALPNGTILTISDPSAGGTQQSVTVSGAHIAGVTSITVNSFTPNFAYPIGAKLGGVVTQPTVTTNTQCRPDFPILGLAASNVNTGKVGQQRGSVTQALPAFGTPSGNIGPTSGVPRITVRLV